MHYLVYIIAVLAATTEGSNLVAIACARNPTLSFCPSTRAPHTSSPTPAHPKDKFTFNYEEEHERAQETRLLDAPSVTAADSVITDEVKRQLAVIAKSVARSRRNPFDDSDLHEKAKDNEEAEGPEEIERDTVEEVKEAKEEEGKSKEVQSVTKKTLDRNDRFTEHHHHSALKELRSSNEEEAHFTSDGFLLYKGDRSEYCEKYHDNYAYFCIGNDNRNQDVARTFCPSYKDACGIRSGEPANPFTKQVSLISSTAQVDEVDTERAAALAKLELLKKRIPCAPECDQRIFPHCTAECKCDYIYPLVQKFCNPPPIPLFLNTCRLWYHGCPKYQQFHYASQYIYSKAEKGKVLPGPARNPNPFGLPQPAQPLPTAGGAAARGARTQRSGFIPQDEDSSENTEHRRGLLIPPDIPKNFRAKDQPENAPTALDKSSAPLVIPPNPYEKPTSVARAHQAATFPVQPSDAAYGSEDAFKAFDGLTDARGVAHRPRSRSPFTKPGLWEANPDNPHNRDHANKWWYHPDSVGVDWLNGQIQWGAHWAVPAAGVGGTHGFSAVHFPTIGTFLGIPDDYD